MTEDISLEFLSRQSERVLAELRAMREDMRAMRTDIDMLTRIVLRVDHTLDALREDIKSLWSSQGDLRRRIEALEQR